MTTYSVLLIARDSLKDRETNLPVVSVRFLPILSHQDRALKLEADSPEQAFSFAKKLFPQFHTELAVEPGKKP